MSGVVLVAGGGISLFFYVNANKRASSVPSLPRPTAPPELVQPRRVGDYELAVSNYEATINDPTKSNEEKAIATYGAAGAKFHVTGDIHDRLEDIRNLKKIVVDSTISLQTRVAALNILAASYYDSGRDPVVSAEVYKDAPFSTYLAPGQPELSARHLYEWSYSLAPTSLAAIRIAEWYSAQYINHPGQSEDMTKAYAVLAEEYMNKADSASLKETQNDPAYLDSALNVNYRYWKANITGRLATQVGEPYLSQYRDVYDEYIAFAQKSPNVLAKEYLFYARLFYSSELVAHKDSKAAKAQLDLLATELSTLLNPNATGFVRFLRNNQKNQPTGFNWTVTKNSFAISPNFQHAVEKIIATTPTSLTATTTVSGTNN